MARHASTSTAAHSDVDTCSGGAPVSDDAAIARARAAALRYLAHRSRTEAEMRRRLRCDFDAAVVDAIVGELKESGLIDDAAFAGAWAEARNSRRPRSARAVRRELLAKGVGRLEADEAVSGLDDEDSAFRAGLPAAQRNAGLPDEAFSRRMWGFLQRRGYGQAVTRRAVERLSLEVRVNAGDGERHDP